VSAITTHVLDTSCGRPAKGVAVVLERRAEGDVWTALATASTNDDGRCPDLLPSNKALAAGVHRLRFATAAYFLKLGVRAFYPEVQVIFEIDNIHAHYHVPLLLSPYGYSTYRGS
jgi:5-hydroxyisourate hydrolase